ncbi:hypothetical protein Y1Q_0009614 [Alligator mississippiensis]|uniref:Uncharacterized protein n=1 Tax=Alligator mississippiensis TaxID=8496 RepID=A0A151NUJ2_ALLMI|nr:hypothetical protein Y1Q_0009614 [Alligator mississippiensis]
MKKNGFVRSPGNKEYNHFGHVQDLSWKRKGGGGVSQQSSPSNTGTIFVIFQDFQTGTIHEHLNTLEKYTPLKHCCFVDDLFNHILSTSQPEWICFQLSPTSSFDKSCDLC